MKRTKVDGITLEFEKILTDISDEAKEAVDKASTDVAQEAAKKLRNNSPKKTGSYAKGWRVKTEKSRRSIKNTVYNATKPQITHLLEWGHLNAANGRRVPPVPEAQRIQPVEQWANNEFEKRVTEALEK